MIYPLWESALLLYTYWLCTRSKSRGIVPAYWQSAYYSFSFIKSNGWDRYHRSGYKTSWTVWSSPIFLPWYPTSKSSGLKLHYCLPLYQYRVVIRNFSAHEFRKIIFHYNWCRALCVQILLLQPYRNSCSHTDTHSIMWSKFKNRPRRNQLSLAQSIASAEDRIIVP